MNRNRGMVFAVALEARRQGLLKQLARSRQFAEIMIALIVAEAVDAEGSDPEVLVPLDDRRASRSARGDAPTSHHRSSARRCGRLSCFVFFLNWPRMARAMVPPI